MSKYEGINTLILLSEDPREITKDWIKLKPEIAGITLVSYVVPFESIKRPGKLMFNDVPIIPWEEPSDDYRRAEQYLKLIKVTKAEYLISLGWDRTIFHGPGDLDYMSAMDRIVFESFDGSIVSRLIHRRIFGDFKRGEDGKIL